MNTIIALLVLSVACVIAAPTESGSLRTLPALDHQEIHDEFGQYTLRYVTADRTIVYEQGRLVPNPDGIGHVMVVKGEVSYIGDDGITYTTKYTAGFDGYNAKGDHIQPVVPPVPAVIEVAL